MIHISGPSVHTKIASEGNREGSEVLSFQVAARRVAPGRPVLDSPAEASTQVRNRHVRTGV